MVKLLFKTPILESCAGQLVEPSKLTYVPPNFADQFGKPLVLTPATKFKYLSYKYPASDWEGLGLKILGTAEFIKDFRKFVLDHALEFQSMPDEWHSRLAEVLVASIMQSKPLQEIICMLRIVPLRNGQWASPGNTNLLFPTRTRSHDLVIPKGIDVVEIHPGAEANHPRRHLFMLLGAKDFVPAQICDIIIQAHSRDDFQSERLSIDDLISHAVFLYKAGWKNAEKSDMFFVTETGTHRLGSQVYMDSDVPYSAKSVFADNRLAFDFLHPKYYDVFSGVMDSTEELETEKWLKWLREHTNVSQLPRLATPSVGAPFTISEDFQFMLKTLPSMEILLLMRHHWVFYSEWIVFRKRRNMEEVWKFSQQQLRAKLSSIEANCRRGTVHPLNQTFLPLSSLQLETFISVPFLDVPEPDDDQWDYLKHFGVVVELDAGFFIECLRRLKESETSVKQVSQLYSQIDLYATRDNAKEIKYV